MMYIV